MKLALLALGVIALLAALSVAWSVVRQIERNDEE